jgi:iron complex transport system substrate-binding protein
MTISYGLYLNQFGSFYPALSMAAALAVAITGLPAAAAPAEKPQRVVSLNLCTDQLLILLAERRRVASVSFLAADPASSAMAREAQGLPLNHGLAEEVIHLRPDLVLAGATAAQPTVALLRRLGHRVVELPLAESLADVAAHIRLVAEALGEEGRGEALIARFEGETAAIPPPPPGPRPVAILIDPNGFTSGAGSLPDAVLRTSGFENLATRLGMAGVGRIPLEAVVKAAPDALILGRLSVEHPSLATEFLSHPALARTVPRHAVIGMDHHLWACAIPEIAQAMERLASFRRGLAAHPLGDRR